jgi:hypothetical protein
VIFRQEKSKFFVKWPSSISHSKTETPAFLPSLQNCPII